VHGDRIRLGRTDAIELIFATDAAKTTGFLDASSDATNLKQMAAILNGLRALGSGRVLDEVLTLVMDSALEVTKAERGFMMLANVEGELEFKIARGKGKTTLSGTTFQTSEKIPREVFKTGKTLTVGDLMEGSLAGQHDRTIAVGIRHVLCVPLKVTPMSEAGSGARDMRVIGVLQLDGREKSTMLSDATRQSLEAFATQAALAIESARLYAESAEKGAHRSRSAHRRGDSARAAAGADLRGPDVRSRRGLDPMPHGRWRFLRLPGYRRGRPWVFAR
jgi:GAF domain-containing protein